MISKGDNHYYYSVYRVDLNDVETYTPFQDYGFDIAFGIGEELDPSYGEFKVQQVKVTNDKSQF